MGGWVDSEAALPGGAEAPPAARCGACSVGGKVVKSWVAGGRGGCSLNRFFRPLRGHPELSGAAVRARASGARPLARVRRDDSNPSLSESLWAGGPSEGRGAPPRRLRSFFPRGAVRSVRTKKKKRRRQKIQAGARPPLSLFTGARRAGAGKARALVAAAAAAAAADVRPHAMAIRCRWGVSLLVLCIVTTSSPFSYLALSDSRSTPAGSRTR